MLKRIFTNPSLLFLIAGNIYCIWYYENYPENFATIVWIYWFQSIIIGFFNFIELQTTRLSVEDIKAVNKKDSRFGAGCAAWFFLFHYGFFHLVYFFFLLADFSAASVIKHMLILGIAIFFLESLMGFIRHKTNKDGQKINIAALFFLPYLRIVPMHLMILLPKILQTTPSVVFLLLKMAADLFTFRIYEHMYIKRAANQYQR